MKSSFSVSHATFAESTRRKGRNVALMTSILMLGVMLLVIYGNRSEISDWYLLSKQFERLQDNAQGYPEYCHRQTGIVFVRLPAGAFVIGSPESEPGRHEDEAQTKVTLSPFLIAKYEVSQGDWRRVMGYRNFFTADTFPVDMVGSGEAEEFCARAGLSLPTEPQWEYACRAGTTTAFAFGEVVTPNQVNFESPTTMPVDSFQPNGFGLFNMHGNVFEWCVRDPRTPAHGDPNGEWEPARGGGCDTGYETCRSAARSSGDFAMFPYGFRPVFSLHSG